MPRRPTFPPQLKIHATGQAYCRWQGRNYYFGKAGSPEAEQNYQRLIARLAAGQPAAPPPTAAAPTVAECVARFLAHVEQRLDRSGGALVSYRYCLRPVLRLHGLTVAAEFGPAQLEEARDAMTGGTWQTGAERERLRRAGRTETRWAASRVNKALGVVRTCWRWCERRGLVPRGASAALATAETVGPRAPGVRRTARRKATSREELDAVLPLIQRGRTHRPVAAMLELQWLAGMRSCEVRLMRGEDVDRAGPVVDGVRLWIYTVSDEANKNSWRGQARTVLLGPRCQEVLSPWLRGAGYVFVVYPQRPVPYTRRAYAAAVRRAAVAAGVEITAYGGRHSAATRARAEFGETATAAFLGHASVDTTAAYGERDIRIAAAVAARLS